MYKCVCVRVLVYVARFMCSCVTRGKRRVTFDKKNKRVRVKSISSKEFSECLEQAGISGHRDIDNTFIDSKRKANKEISI